MKRITLQNGEIIHGYELKDLTGDVYNKVISDHINFEIEIMNKDSYLYPCVGKMERMQTPWFLAEYIWDEHKNDIIETIEINDYLFDDDGELLPICYHTKGNETVKTTFGKREIECVIEQI